MGEIVTLDPATPPGQTETPLSRQGQSLDSAGQFVHKVIIDINKLVVA